jgi:hypothetical protein
MSLKFGFKNQQIEDANYAYEGVSRDWVFLIVFSASVCTG